MTTASLDISEVLPKFPDFRVALVVAAELVIAEVRSPALARAVAAVESEVAARLGGQPLGEIAELKAWRAAYKAFGVKKTSYRSSVERLVKAIQQGRGLPEVSSLVDGYNAVSAKHLVPIGADDLDKLSGDLAFRMAREADSFFALGAARAQNDPPKAGEVVYADGEKLLCRRWNWYQDARSATTAATRHAVLTIQSLGNGDAPEKAAAELCGWLQLHCRARAAWTVADGRVPRVALRVAPRVAPSVAPQSGSLA